MPKISQVAFQCLNCKTEIPSPFQFGDTESFESSTLARNRLQCPKCGHVVPCNKENMRYTNADGKRGGFSGNDYK